MKCRLEKAADGHRVPVVDIDGAEIHLGSMYDGRKAAEIWCDQKLSGDPTDIVLIGMGDLQIVLEAASRVKERVLVYEPEQEIYDAVRTSPLFKKANKNPRIRITDNRQLMSAWITELLNDEILDETVFYVHPGYYRNTWMEPIEDIHRIIIKNLENLYKLKGALSVMIDYVVMNELRNIHMMKDGVFLTRLQKKWNRDIPVVIVGAGPSLKKNAAFLQEARNKVCIICMDSALVPLVNMGVRPHMVATIDATKYIEVFGDLDSFDYPLLVASNSVAEAVRASKGSKIWAYESHPLPQKLRELIEELPPIFPTDYGVSSLAFSTAIELGTKKIVFVGCDLAYSETGESHSDNFDGMLDFVYDAPEEIMVDGYYGKKVKSHPEWIKMKNWYEDTIDEDDFGYREYINCTEGGVCIQGTRQVPLKEFLDSLPENTGEWYDLINDPSVHISEEEYSLLMKRYHEELDNFKEIKNRSYEEIFYDPEFKRPMIYDLFMTVVRSREEPTRRERFEKAIEQMSGYIEQYWKDVRDGYFEEYTN